jgi:hypothetical protein
VIGGLYDPPICGTVAGDAVGRADGGGRGLRWRRRSRGSIYA